MADTDDLDVFFLASEQLADCLSLGLDGAGRSFLDKDVPVLSVLECEKHQIYRLFEAHYESGHLRLCHRDRKSAADLLYPERDDAAAGAHHVAVAGAADLGVAGVTALGHCNLFLNSLGDTHRIDRICRLVGREADDTLDIVLDGCSEDIICSYHIGFHGLHREEFAARHLLQRGGMEDIVRTGHGAPAAFKAADISDIEFYLVCHIRVFGLVFMAHVILFFLVTGEYPYLRNVCSEETLEDSISETTGTAGNHQGFSCKNAHGFIRCLLFFGSVVQLLILRVPAFVFRDDILHGLDDGHVVECPGDLHEVPLVLTGGGIVVFTHLGDHDLGVRCRDGALLVVEDLLVELLPVTQAGELYLHILRSGQGDHPPGQVDNLHGLTHVEDEDLASLAHGTRLKYQRARLGDEHEVANDVRVGDGDRTAVTDLLLKDGDHAAVGAQDVAEPGGHELCHALHPAFLDGLAEALAVDLADALAAAHDVGRVDGLVGGDHDELTGHVLHRKVGYHTGAVDVVLYGYRRVVLHHRDMLVGGGMEDVFRPARGEYAFHMRGIGDARHYGLARYVRELPAHHPPDAVHRGLSLVYEGHPGRAELGHLAHYLRAYRPGRTGDEYPAALEHPPYGAHVHLDLLPREQVLYIHLVQLVVGQVHILPVPFLPVGHHHDAYSLGDELVHHLLVGPELIRLQRRDEKRLHALGLESPGDALAVEIDRLAHEVRPLHLLPVGDKGVEGVFLVLH